jgi:predicted ATPase
MDEAAYDAANPALSGSDRLVVVSGCSGGGKSTLLAEMAWRGWPVFPEPGRQIVREQALVGGPALPWTDLAAFAELVLSRAMHLFALADPGSRAVLFDRGIVDAVTALERIGRALPHHAEAVRQCRYGRRVFMVAPWEALFARDGERRHGFAAAVAEHEALMASYAAKGYDTVVVPRGPVADRADFLEAALSSR